MNSLIQFFYGLFKREEGQTLPEYGLILFFIAIVSIVALTVLGVNVSILLDQIATAL